MIIISDNRVLVTYARTNRRVKWDYSEYCGRWSTIDECIRNAKDHFHDEQFEYRIENLETGEVVTGLANLQ